MITTIIPTKNESIHIARCIQSVAPLGPVVVIDSESTDGTAALATQLGATVLVRPWTGYAEQKNWALSNAGIETEWVLLMDADEFLTATARTAICEAIGSTRVVGYWLPRRYVFLGRELRYAWWYPDFQLRLFRSGSGTFEQRAVHEHLVVDGPVAELSAELWHENLKGLSAFVDRHNRYAALEASELHRPKTMQRVGSWTGNWADRRRALKTRVWMKLPGRPAIRFLWLYLVQQGFRDGRPGLIYCYLISSYDFLINAMAYEDEVGGRAATYDTSRPHPKSRRRPR